MEIAYVLAAVVGLGVCYLIYRKSQKPGSPPRQGPKGTPRPGPGDDR